jgi:hypothetical protein
LALVKGVDNNEGLNLRRLERSNNEFLHLRTKDLPSDIRICPQDLKQLLSERWIPVGELEGECREDHLKIAPVLEIPRAEKAGPELSVREARLGECLGDG